MVSMAPPKQSPRTETFVTLWPKSSSGDSRMVMMLDFDAARDFTRHSPPLNRPFLRLLRRHTSLSPDEDFGHKVTKVSVRGDCFGGAIDTIPWEQRKPYDEFDYGYVLTVHKSQGSQWDDVVLFDESFAFQESRARWLYTGITRAAKRLSVVV